MRFARTVAARLKHQISILVKDTTTDMDTDRWRQQMVTYAEIKDLSEVNYSTMDGLNFGNLITEAYCLLCLRFIKGINNDMRIQSGERTFEIKRIIDHSKRDGTLQIIALEISNNVC